MNKPSLEISEESFLNQKRENEQLKNENIYLNEQINLLKRALFGKKSEKIIATDENQLLIPLHCESSEESIPEQEQISYTRKKRKPTGKNTLEFPDDLLEEVIYLDLTEEEKICSVTKEPLKKIGENVVKKLAKKPSEFYIKKYIVAKYAREDTSEVLAKRPTGLFEKGKVDESIIADVITKKYSDHLPLYRIAEVYSRSDIAISRQLLSRWVVSVGKALRPIYEGMIKRQLDSQAIFIDETPCDLLVKNLNKAHKAFMWVTVDAEFKYRLFHFRISRQQKHAKDLLEGYQGVYHSDQYKPYRSLADKKDLIWSPCYVHMRRKFYEIPFEMDLKKRILKLFGDLFEVERNIKECSSEEILKVRQNESIPIIHELTSLIKNVAADPSILPKSALRKACNYYLGVEKYLENYTKNAFARLDNNEAERAIRPLAIGRKNWLFMGSEEGGYSAAVLLSLVQTCRGLSINPYDYFDDILRRVQDHPINRIEELFPDNWKKLVNPS